LRRGESGTRRIIHRATHESTRHSSRLSLLNTDLVALGDLALQLLPADFTALSQGDVKRLVSNHLVVHLGDSLRRLIRRRVANESETLRCSLVVPHNLRAGNRAKELELSPKFIIINIIL
jgi:hypothetical protein